MGKIFYLIIYQFVCLAAREPNKIIFFLSIKYGVSILKPLQTFGHRSNYQ